MSGKWGPGAEHWGGTVGSGLFAEKLPEKEASAAFEILAESAEKLGH